MQRGVVSKIAAHLAERIYETLQVAECLDTQCGVNQVARLQETQPGGDQLKDRRRVVIQLVEESEQAAQEAIQALVVRDELVGVLPKLRCGRQLAPASACQVSLQGLQHALLVFQFASVALEDKLLELAASQLAFGVGYAFDAMQVAEEFDAQVVEVLVASGLVDGSVWREIFPDDGIADSSKERYSVDLNVLGAGEHTISLRAFDNSNNVGNISVTFRR